MFKLFGEIIINDGEVISKLNKIDSKAKSTGGVFQKLGNSVIQGIGVFAGGAIFNGIVTGLDKVKTMGMDFNSSMEQARTNFTTFLGSTEKANKLLGELSKLAKDTPFELTDLTKGSQMLLNYGVPLEKNIDSLTRLGDIAMGDKDKLNGLVMAFGQIKGNGRLMGEELNQMIERGFNPLAIISKQTKKSMADLREEMSDGEISFEMVEKAIVSATSSGGQFYNSMQNSSKTFKGQMATLNDNLSQTFGKLVEPIFTRLSTVVLPKLNSSFDEINKRVNMYMPAIKQILVSTWETSGNALTWFSKNVLPVLVDGFFIVKSYIENNVIPTWQRFVNFITPWLPVLKQAFMATFTVVKDILYAVIPPIIDLANRVFPILGNIFVWFCTVIAPVFISTMKFLSGTIIPMLRDTFNSVFPQIANIINTAWLIIRNVATALVGIWQWAAPLIRTVFVYMVDSMRDKISAFVGAINGLMNFISGVFTGNWGKAWNGVKQVFHAALEGLPGIAKIALNGMISVVNKGISALNKLSVKLPAALGGSTLGLSIGHIPYLAEGGNIIRSGSAVVGENGAELIDLPKGARVTPLNNKNAGVTLIVNNPKFFNQRDIDNFMNPVIKQLKISMGV